MPKTILCPLTHRTTSNKQLDMLLHFWPPDPLLQSFKHFSRTQMSSIGTVVQLLQKLLTTTLPPRNKQLHMPIIQNTVSKLQTMHLSHGKLRTGTLCQVHKTFHVPVMLLSFVDTTKPLRGYHKGVQTWCQTRARLVSHRCILQNVTRI